MKIVTVVGARPQFIKAAVISSELGKLRSDAVTEVLVHTGQHYDDELSDVFFRELEIPCASVNLRIGSDSGGAQTGRMLEALEHVLRREQPEWVLVYGDTNSTLAGALAAAYQGVPVAHVEAGLRSFNRQMPEEVNRVLTDHLAELLFCPTPAAVENLRREGITSGVHAVGDVMYDCLLRYADWAEKASPLMERFGVTAKGFFLATVHRAENTDDPGRLASITRALARVHETLGPVIWPLHPRTRKAMAALGGIEPGSVRLTSPLSYLDLQSLMANARCVLTDSGGIQKEAVLHRVPCVTLRGETEWVETVALGCNVLVSADESAIVEAAAEACFPADGPPADLYGNGQAGRKIIEILRAS